jgi:methionyl-tRNA formyltransferase
MARYRIVFMGTPEFSVPTLRSLHESDHELLAVVTNPDRPKGRGRVLAASPVKEAAIALGYPVLQPVSVKETSFVQALDAYAPDVLVVIAYGRILPAAVLAIPRLGPINIHASLLPKYRGPAPIQWAIINGDKETGVTTMWMDEGMDTGDTLLAVRVPIGGEDTSETLHHRLAGEGAKLLLDTLEGLTTGTVARVPQDHSQATYAPFLKKEDGLMDWRKDAETLGCFVRGMSPWPGAYTLVQGKRLKVFKAQAVARKIPEKPGTVLEGFPGDLDVAAGDGILRLLEVQLESGRRLPARDFLMGFSVKPGSTLG